MNSDSKQAKPLTPYKQEQLKQQPREAWCGKMHSNIEEAIVCAETNLGMHRKPAQPYWGKTRFGEGVIVGWQVNDAKRYRLDFTPNFQEENAKAAEWAGTAELKGSQGVHVNEENFHDPIDKNRSRICHPTQASLQWADTYWRKWTKSR